MFGNRKEEKKREKYISFPCLVCKSKKNDSSSFFFLFYMPPYFDRVKSSGHNFKFLVNENSNVYCPKFFMNSLSITALPKMDILRTMWVRFASFSFPSHKPNRGNVF